MQILIYFCGMRFQRQFNVQRLYSTILICLASLVPLVFLGEHQQCCLREQEIPQAICQLHLDRIRESLACGDKDTCYSGIPFGVPTGYPTVS